MALAAAATRMAPSGISWRLADLELEACDSRCADLIQESSRLLDPSANEASHRTHTLKEFHIPPTSMKQKFD